MNIFEKISLGISAESAGYGLDNEEAKVNFENDYEEALLILDECDKDAVEARGAVEVMHKMVSGEAITYINEDGEEETEEVSGEAGVKHAALRTAYKAKGGIAKLIQAIKSTVMRILFRIGATDGKFKKIKTKITEYKKALEKNSKLKEDFEMTFKDYTTLAETLHTDIGAMMTSVKNIRDTGSYGIVTIAKIVKPILDIKDADFNIPVASGNSVDFSKEDADRINTTIKDAVADRISDLNDKLKDVEEKDLEGSSAVSTVKNALSTMEGFANQDFKFKQVYAKIEKIFNKAMKDAESGKGYDSSYIDKTELPFKENKTVLKTGDKYKTKSGKERTIKTGRTLTERESASDDVIVRILSVAHNGLKGAATVTNKKMAVLDRCLNETINQAAKVRAAVQVA